VETARIADGPPREKPQQIADEVRGLIAGGELSRGELLGSEPDLVERFGVSRPSLREALRILEAEGLIAVVRGVHGGIYIREPDESLTARTAALFLQANSVPLADVYQARCAIEPAAVRMLAESRKRRTATDELSAMVDAQELLVDDVRAFTIANLAFHEHLVELSGNQTLSLLANAINQILVRALTVDGLHTTGSVGGRRRNLRSMRRLLELVDDGDASDAEEHWRTHMAVIGKIMLGEKAADIVDFTQHYE
jgi:DNA-binding FadR family transcriptional regulator